MIHSIIIISGDGYF